MSKATREYIAEKYGLKRNTKKYKREHRNGLSFIQKCEVMKSRPKPTLSDRLFDLLGFKIVPATQKNLQKYKDLMDESFALIGIS